MVRKVLTPVSFVRVYLHSPNPSVTLATSNSFHALEQGLCLPAQYSNLSTLCARLALARGWPIAVLPTTI